MFYEIANFLRLVKSNAVKNIILCQFYIETEALMM
jgi:hypothetical protein